MTTATQNTVPQTILSQISTMTKMSVGARDFMSDGNSLIFRVGPGGTRKVKITLDANDLYTVELFKFRKKNGIMGVETRTITEGAYFDMLDDSLMQIEREEWAC